MDMNRIAFAAVVAMATVGCAVDGGRMRVKPFDVVVCHYASPTGTRE